MNRFDFNFGSDKHKMFLVNRSQLAGRFDPQFHLELPDLTGFVKLSSIANVNGGKRIPLGYNYSQNKTENLYLRVADFNNEGEIDFRQLRYIDDEVFRLLERYEIHNNQIAISIAGTIGRVTLIKNIPKAKRVILTENCAKITLKTDDVLESYLALLLNLPVVQKQIELNYIQTTIPKLGLDRIKNLFFPRIPSKQDQEKIIQAYSDAFVSVKQKEQQAQALLASIDAYLLAELGIALQSRDNTIENRMFKISLNEVSGGRLDAYFNYSLKNSNLKTKYPTVSIKSAFKSYSGGTPSKANLSYWTGDVPWVSPKDFKALKLIDTEDHITKEAIKNSAITMAPKGSLLMVVRSGVLAHTIPVAITTKPMAFNQDVKAFIAQADVTTEFLAVYIHILNNQILPLIVKHSTTVQSINTAQLNTLKIPVLPTHLQEIIVAHVQTIRIQAQQLQAEAAQILANAKAEVERMILGE